jgi:hypothetical protein
LPENMGPTTTSIQPILPFTMSTGCSWNGSYWLLVFSS